MFTDRINTLFQKADVEAVYIASPKNLRYYSGFTGGEGVLILQPDSVTLFTDSRYTLQAQEEAPDAKIMDIAVLSPQAFLTELHPDRAGWEEDFLTAGSAAALRSTLPQISWLNVSPTILAQRSVKDTEEQKKIRQAAALADEAYRRVLPLLKPGIRELDIALELEWSMRKNGASSASFPIICASGYRSAMPHGIAGMKKLEAGDFVTMDFGCFLDGYASDMTRTVVLGSASAEQKKIYHTVLTAQKNALELLQAGITGKEADNAARSVISAAGYGSCFGHALGHGVGLQIHEQPTLSPRSETVLRPGMAVTAEPGIYVDKLGGVRIEDLVIITETGCENLTHSDKELLEL